MPPKKFQYRGRFYGSTHASALAAAQDLKSEDYLERRFGVAELNRVGSDAAPHLPLLVTVLSDEDAGVRYWATITLAEFGPQLANDVDALAPGLKDPDPGIRYWATVAVGRVGAAAGGHGGTLKELLEDTDPHVRVAAARALTAVDPSVRAEAVETLSPSLSPLTERDSSMRAGVAEALGTLGDAALPCAPALGKALGDRYPTVRLAAARALQALGATAVEQCREPLARAALTDADSEVREVAASALAHSLDFGAALEDQDDSVRAWAVETIADSGTTSTQHIAALGAALSDKSAEIRRFAAVALRNAGQDAETHSSALVATIGDSDARVRVAVIGALVCVDPTAVPGALQLLAPSLHHEEASFRAAAAEGFATAGPAAALFAESLAKCLDDQDGSVRLATLRAVGNGGRVAMKHADASVARIAKEDRDPQLRREALEALRRYGLAVKFGLPD